MERNTVTGMCRLTARLLRWSVMIVIFAGCGAGGSGASPSAVDEAATVAPGTAEPGYALTLQAQAAATAAWVGELTPLGDLTTEPAITPDFGTADGVNLSARTGACPLPAGYELHQREGFCVAAPATWAPYNVDGGLAATLHTTPGQVISLKPESAACTLMMYIASETSVVEHLEMRHERFANQNQVTDLTPIVMRSVGEIAVPGFAWETADGESGRVYADLLSRNRLAHISFSGTSCPVSELASVLNTLRFSEGR